ncbi:MAG: FAD-dependent oxidoreductase [Verrucomicrobiales bacterium]|jgi:hypothetical protein|nr:FAD-dependent oxidoreductase [Verrucomicrobiales bacterium]
MKRRAFIKSAGVLGLASGLAWSPSASAAPARSDDRWDVLVVGGGPAGCAAAIAAARAGAKTLLIESTGCLGGMGTSGLVPAWTPFSDGERVVYQGLALTVFNESGQGVPHIPPGRYDWVDINPEYLKTVYDHLTATHGVSVRFFTRLAAVEMRADDELDRVVVAGKVGLTALKAKVYVDCTGDGDLAAWAGAAFELNPGAAARQMPTLCFTIAGVDHAAMPDLYGGRAASPIHKILESGKYPLIVDTHLCANKVGPGVVQFNAGHLRDVDPLDEGSLSAAMARGRAQAAQFLAAFKEYAPAAFARALLVNTGGLLGVRESRRVTGDYTFTTADWLARREFDDGIGRNNYYIDVHVPAMNDHSYPHYGKGESHGIPYRILTPRGKRNLLVAGRCVSADTHAAGSLRVQPACLVTGEAAGLAAALACRQPAPDVHAVDLPQLRQRLREAGQLL